MNRLLTQKIFIPLAHFRRRRRADMRAVFAAYEEGLKFRRATKNWTEEQKRAWILQALRRAVRRAAAETDYYAGLFQKINFDPKADFTFEDFARLPILERENVLQAREKLITKNMPREQMQKDATGGSTGAPTEIWLGAEERGWKESGIDFSFERIGISQGAKTAYFWGHHLDPQASDSFADRLRAFVTNVRWFDCFRLSPEVFSRYHEEFERWKPDCIVAYAGALGQFAEFLKENKIRPKNYPRVCFVTGAEKLDAHHRNAIEEVFGKPVYERYGGRDFGGAAIQTGAASGNLEYEIDWAWSLLEPETDEENSSILVTKLHADAMPLLRYRTGDVGRFPAASKSGEPTFVLREVVGRELDRIWLPDGSWVQGSSMPHLLKDFAVREFAVIQAADYGIELQIAAKKGFDDGQKSAILQTVGANFPGLPVEIKLVERVARTRANKLRPVVSHVKR